MGFIFSHLLVQVNILLMIHFFFASVSWCKKIKVKLIPKFLLETYCFVQSFFINRLETYTLSISVSDNMLAVPLNYQLTSIECITLFLLIPPPQISLLMPS